MRRERRFSPVLIAAFLAAQPAAGQVRAVRTRVPAVPLPAGAAGASLTGAPLLGTGLTLSPLLPGSAALPSVRTGLSAADAVSLRLPAAGIPSAVSPAPRAVGRAPAASPKTRLGRKLTAIRSAVEEAGRGIAEGSSEDGYAAAKTQFDALGGGAAESMAELIEADMASRMSGLRTAGAPSAKELLGEDWPVLPRRTAKHVLKANAALEEAIGSAVGRFLPEGGFRVRSRGSTSRLTFVGEDPDYDIMVRFPEAWSTEKLEAFLRKESKPLHAALEDSVAAEARRLFPSQDIRVETGSGIHLSDPVTRKPDLGILMIPLQVYGSEGLLLDVDVSLSVREKYTNDYPGYFQDQMGSVMRLGGEAAVEEVLGSIRLTKRLFKEIVGAYKVWRGGPSGVGIEQMVMQSGSASDADKGRTISEPGSFDLLMDRIYQAAFDEQGRSRAPEEAKALWTVHNPFREPANFLTHIGKRAWAKLADAAWNYRLARSTGRPIRLSELGRRRSEPASPRTAPEEKEKPLPLVPMVKVQASFRSDLDSKKLRRRLKETVRRLRGDGVEVLRTDDSWSRAKGKKGGRTNAYSVEFLIEGDAARAEIEEALAKIGGLRGLEVSEPAPLGEDELVLQVEFWKADRARIDDAVKKISRRLGKRLGSPARISPPSPGPKGSYIFRITAGASESAPVLAKRAAALFDEAGVSAKLVKASLSERGPPDAGAPSELGQSTLEMLERFTLSGPKPSERGEAFLMAQGAAPVPEALTGTWKDFTRRTRRIPSSRRGPTEVRRTILMRNNGRTFILVPKTTGSGMTIQMPKNIAPELAAGVVANTLVEIETVGGEATALTPIGSYPMDMVIGRVVRKGKALVLGSIFSKEGKARSAYGDLPLGEGVPAAEGDILQVFVQPAGKGFEAVPLLSLGKELTPEIAAREIALRQGARGYFDSGVIAQAETAVREEDIPAMMDRIRDSVAGSPEGLRVEDLSRLPFVTIDPVGAGDLDDAFYIEKKPGGGYTWYLATADVDQYVAPGSPAFRAAARIGNTFYSIDKDGVPEYPMNHPVVSKYAASLLAGKDSVAMISKMSFAADGTFLKEDSDVFLARVQVQGRYTYDQVVKMWKGNAGHGVAHPEQVRLARELADKLNKSDQRRGKLQLSLSQTRYLPLPEGGWTSETVEEDPLTEESHRLIEELKVYGNRTIATILGRILEHDEVPHISRVHPKREDSVNLRLRKELKGLGVPWRDGVQLWDYLAEIQEREDLSPEVKETAQMLALMSRASAEYVTVDEEGHEGLALEAGAYDHPSTPIRRFSDMYNRALLEAYLSGHDPKEVYAAVLEDLRSMGFQSLAEYTLHLNGREQAAKQMDREVAEFMSVYELAKPGRENRTYTGYVKLAKTGRNPKIVIQLRELPVTVTLIGAEAASYKLLDEVEVTVRSADPAKLQVDMEVRKTGNLRQNGRKP